MSEPRVYSLEPIRTDGWFERVGESVGSFDALCEIVGKRFFAFSLITGARIIALSVDRQNLAESVVEFEVGGGAVGPGDSRSLSLARFRHRLAAALVAEEQTGPQPERDTDTEAIQMHVGVRYLLLAPLFGYGLIELRCQPSQSTLVVSRDGMEREFELDDFQQLLRSHVLEELDRAESQGTADQSGIDLAKIDDARRALDDGQYSQVIDILGPWAAPLSILLRTPDGQLLGSDVKASLSGALGVLGEALGQLGDHLQAEEILRLAVQYAIDTPGAGAAYARLGSGLMSARRPGEAIGCLRRAVSVGAEAATVWPLLSAAYLERGRLLAALSAAHAGVAAGLSDPRLEAIIVEVYDRLVPLSRWRALVCPGDAPT